MHLQSSTIAVASEDQASLKITIFNDAHRRLSPGPDVPKKPGFCHPASDDGVENSGARACGSWEIEDKFSEGKDRMPYRVYNYADNLA